MTDSTALRLVCSEIWGGNRPVHRPIELPGVRGVLYSRPCHGAKGGDVHYLSVCGSGLLSRMCIADVVGHGETVAAVSGQIHGLVRKFMNQPNQRRILTDLNLRLHEMGLGAMTTAAALSYYPPHRRLSFSYAGHPPAWFYSVAQGRWTRLDRLEEAPGNSRVADLPLAVDDRTVYSRGHAAVAPGDRLLVITDGILEAPDPAGGLFGEQRLERLLADDRTATCEQLSDRLLAALGAHCHCSTLDHDDVTFVLVEFAGPRRGPAVWHALVNRVLRRRGNSASAGDATPLGVCVARQDPP